MLLGFVFLFVMIDVITCVVSLHVCVDVCMHALHICGYVWRPGVNLVVIPQDRM